MGFNKELIQSLSGDNIFLRGEEYYRAGFVKSFTWKDKKVYADVTGSKRKPYQVIVCFQKRKPLAKCNCDQGVKGVFCKHAVALLLHLLALGETGKDPVDSIEEKSIKFNETLSLENDFLSSFEEPVIMQLGLSVKHLSSTSCLKVPFSFKLLFKDIAVDISDLEDLEDSLFLEEHHLPSVDVWNTEQQNLIQKLKLFNLMPEKYSQHVVWYLLPFQIAMILEDIDSEQSIAMVDLITRKKITLMQDPMLKLKMKISQKSQDEVEVESCLLDVFHLGCDGPPKTLFQYRKTWIFHEPNGSFCLLDHHIEPRIYQYFLQKKRLFNGETVENFFFSILPKIQSFLILETTTCDAYLKARELFDDCRVRFEVDVDHKHLLIRPVFLYGDLSVVYHPKKRRYFVSQEQNGSIVFSRRHFLEEDKKMALFHQYVQSVFDESHQAFRIQEPQQCYDFLTQGIEGLKGFGEVFLKKEVLGFFQQGESLDVNVRLQSTGIDWFSYDVSFMKDGQLIDISLSQIQESVKKAQPFIQLKTGELIALEGSVLEKLTHILNVKKEPVVQNLNERLMLAHIPFMMASLQEAGVSVDMDEATATLYEELKSFQKIEDVTPPSGVENILRDYQKHGLSWLGFLKKFRFGGILADEMGLGKTLQALAMMVKNKEQGEKKPSLVVCPTTLVWNWEHEIHKFFPHMKVLIANGKNRRQQLKDLSGMDIVITSYALLRRDIDDYEQCFFDYIVLDEAQNIKNRYTISAKTVKRLKSDYRLALTGTPLENSIADLWSIFDFLMPSFLGDYESFRSFYESPILQDQDEGRFKELSKKISPFVLRRLKQDVIKELPEKIEQIVFCELESAQAKLYASLAEKARQQVLKVYQQSGFGKGKMLMLTLLLRLRQLCCHPHLTGVSLKHDIGVSAKTDLFKEMILEATSSGHRILVFSQFVEMLKILKKILEEENISFEFMDGQTKDRQQKVQRFNQQKNVKVFLLSLKVGGLGLNLTSADTVILYEPWWNPSVEQQAIDRAHRIGQKKVVVAYHLIAKGTIEERIVELQNRKRGMMDSLIVSEEHTFKNLTWEDMQFLLGI